MSVSSIWRPPNFGGYAKKVNDSVAPLRKKLTIPSGQRRPVHMTLKLALEVENRLSPTDAAIHLAIGLYVSKEYTLGQASGVAGLSQGEFMRDLGRRQIPINYGAEDLAVDLKTVEELLRQ
jgi:predicted HTH domain antitoxin